VQANSRDSSFSGYCARLTLRVPLQQEESGS
jgi:hypothetical protein